MSEGPRLILAKRLNRGAWSQLGICEGHSGHVAEIADRAIVKEVRMIEAPQIVSTKAVAVGGVWSHEEHDFTPWLAEHLEISRPTRNGPINLQGNRGLRRREVARHPGRAR